MDADATAFKNLLFDTASHFTIKYAFVLIQKPSNDEPVKPIKLVGVQSTVWPMAFHEFAYVLPNSAFTSGGSGFLGTFSQPMLTSNRTRSSELRDANDQTHRVPPHTFVLDGDGTGTLEFKHVFTALPFTLFDEAAAAYAKEIASRFQWAANEKLGKSLEFSVVRRTVEGSAPKIVPLDNTELFVPHAFQIDEVKLDALDAKATDYFFDGLSSLEREMHDTDDEDEGLEWGAIIDRLQSWTREAKDNDLKVFQTPKQSNTQPDEMDQDTLLALIAERQRRLELAAAGRDEPPAAARTNSHSFYIPAASDHRNTESLLILATITLVEGDKPNTTYQKKFPTFTSVSNLEVFLDDKKFNDPLFQRFRFLVANDDVKKLVEGLVQSVDDKSIDTFLDNKAYFRSLGILAESVVVFRRVIELYKKTDPTEDPNLERFLKASEAFENVINKRFSVVAGRYNKRVEWEETSEGWIEYGGARSHKRVEIKLSIPAYANGVFGMTPATYSPWIRALKAALARLRYNPKPQNIENAFPSLN